MEFALTLPIFCLLLVGGFSMAMGMYEAHMASDAVRHIAVNKMPMAQKPGAVGNGDIMTYIAQSGLRGSLPTTGTYVDSVNIAHGSLETAIVVGTKNYSALAGWVPDLTIRVTQPINRALLEPAYTGGGTVRPANTAWVPGGTPVPPPWGEGQLAGMITELETEIARLEENRLAIEAARQALAAAEANTTATP